MSVRVISHRAEVLSAVAKAKKRALEICGEKGETYAKKGCPVKTGWLRDHITHEQVDDDTEAIGTEVVYAPYVELGHRKRYVAKGKPDHVDGKYFLTNAIKNHMSEYQRICENELGKI